MADFTCLFQITQQRSGFNNRFYGPEPTLVRLHDVIAITGKRTSLPSSLKIFVLMAGWGSCQVQVWLQTLRGWFITVTQSDFCFWCLITVVWTAVVAQTVQHVNCQHKCQRFIVAFKTPSWYVIIKLPTLEQICWHSNQRWAFMMTERRVTRVNLLPCMRCVWQVLSKCAQPLGKQAYLLEQTLIPLTPEACVNMRSLSASRLLG